MKKTRFQEFYKNNSLRRKIEVREYLRGIRKATLDLLGGKCVKCGFDDFRALQIDHINGGGVKDKKRHSQCYCNVVKKSFLAKENKYQLLCVGEQRRKNNN